ncbi:MAG: MarR family winged helix-turn-helix transcriptional regulator [bacterium]|nr:MarR family winged helix-turn-helix transcriptional regulator [bacterium]
MNTLMHTAEQVSLFCRLNMNIRKDIPIRSSEMGLLIYLVKSSGSNTPLEAAKYFKVSKGMITNMVTSLTKKGYIIREKSMEDKRSYLLLPTKIAIELVNKTYDENFKIMATIQEKLGTDDFQMFTTMLEKVNEILLEEKNNG